MKMGGEMKNDLKCQPNYQLIETFPVILCNESKGAEKSTCKIVKVGVSEIGITSTSLFADKIHRTGAVSVS